MVVMRRYGKSRRTLEGQEVKSFYRFSVGEQPAYAYRAGHNDPNWHFLLHKEYCALYWILHKHSGCMYSHGCCIQTVCMDGTLQRKNVILVSIDVIRRNTDTKISKLKHQHPGGSHCTLQTSSLTYNVILVVFLQLQFQLQSYFFSFSYFFQLLFQLFDISVTVTVILNINKFYRKQTKLLI